MTAIQGIWSWLRLWFQTRDRFLFVAALPSLVVGGAGLTLVALGATSNSQEVDGRYLDQARAAFKARDYPAAMTCYERLAAHGPERPEVLFGLAQTARALGQTQRALNILSGLAPPDRTGYAPAHLVLAQLLCGHSGQAPEILGLAETHLLKALQGDLDDPDEAHALLGQVYLFRRQYDPAYFHLTRATLTRPHLRMLLARLHQQRNDPEAARREARAVASYYEARVKSNQENSLARFTWADAVAFLEDFSQAVHILETGLALEADAATQQDYHQALGKVYASWLDWLDRQPNPSFEEKLRLLELGQNQDPTNPGLMRTLFLLTRLGGAQGGEARVALERLLERGQATPMVHMALGLIAWEEHKEVEARVHLEAAHRLAPQNPEIANNLSWFLLQASSPDLPRALDLSEQALRRSPANPVYHGTRGHILLRMGRWQEALVDLEIALKAAPNDIQYHLGLAEAYHHLGVPNMADKHRRLAQEVRRFSGAATVVLQNQPILATCCASLQAQHAFER